MATGVQPSVVSAEKLAFTCACKHDSARPTVASAMEILKPTLSSKTTKVLFNYV